LALLLHFGSSGASILKSVSPSPPSSTSVPPVPLRPTASALRLPSARSRSLSPTTSSPSPRPLSEPRRSLTRSFASPLRIPAHALLFFHFFLPPLLRPLSLSFHPLTTRRSAKLPPSTSEQHVRLQSVYRVHSRLVVHEGRLAQGGDSEDQFGVQGLHEVVGNEG
jgi:hypothetical protein